MNNTLIDNSSEQLSMLKTIKECLSTTGIKTVSIATGYWDVPGLALLTDDFREFLEQKDTTLRLLIGKDPYIYAGQLKEPKYKSHGYPQDFIKTDIHELEPTDEFKEAIQLLLDYCSKDDDSKIQIKIYRRDENEDTQFLHSKCYIFTGSTEAIGIVGSSNFTQKGLEGNAELNYMETGWFQVTSKDSSNPMQKSHIMWFEEKWAISEWWNEIFLEQILFTAPITKEIKNDEKKSELINLPDEFTPYELYIKLLQLKFGEIVDMNITQQIEHYLPDNYIKLSYQIDAVKQCWLNMQEHGGFMLSDVVGLGKTIVGVLLIKRFILMPEDDGRERKVLIVTPPAIKNAWVDTINDFDKDREDKISSYVDYITTGSIGKLVDIEDGNGDDLGEDDDMDSGDFEDNLQDKNYGLILIDESHKFRNSGTHMYNALDELISKIGLETGEYPYIGLLSATPQNNHPDDLKNQIYLFERNHNNSTLKKAKNGDIKSFFAEESREYEALKDNSLSKEERRRRLDAMSKRIRDCVLCDIIERRTRTDIKKFYKEDMELQGIMFPEIDGPNNLEYIMDDELAQLFFDTMNIIDSKGETVKSLKYIRYRAIEYFANPDIAKLYTGRGNRSVQDVSKQLAKIMQNMLVKRLESSFAAFTRSLHNLKRYTENMINMWENNTIFVCPQIDVNKELDYQEKTKKQGKNVTFEDCINDLRKKIDKLDKEGRNDKKQNAEYTCTDFNPEYINLLKKDYQLISDLCDQWAQNSEDPKFDRFKKALEEELFDPNTNTAGKLVIFSEAIDTVKALKRAVENRGHKTLVITAANRSEKEIVIKENFDANYKGEWKNDYQVIITTEVLAEGVNLHRANVILNYDTPWNATRLMQRIGRVNRIGSEQPVVYVYNFYPSAQGDAMINLVRRAYTKLQSFHVLFGEDSKIFSEEETVITHDDIIKDIDDIESPLEKYIFELKQYKLSHPERYAIIEDCNEEWEIASSTDGIAYFAVKAPRSTMLYVRIKEDGGRKTEIIPLIDMLEEMRVDVETPRIDLPDNWEELKKDAEKAYQVHFVTLNKSKAGDKRTKATTIITQLYSKPNLSEKSKSILKNARKLADKGNYDVIKAINAINDDLADAGNQLFQLSQEEIDIILETKVESIVANVETKQGKAQIILGTIKS